MGKKGVKKWSKSGSFLGSQTPGGSVFDPWGVKKGSKSTHFGVIWVILGSFGSFWGPGVDFGHFGSFWAIFGHFWPFWPFWAILGHFGHFGPFWVIFARSIHFLISLRSFFIRFPMVRNDSGLNFMKFTFFLIMSEIVSFLSRGFLEK